MKKFTNYSLTLLLAFSGLHVYAQKTMKTCYESRFVVTDQNADSSYNAFGVNAAYLHVLTLDKNLNITKEKKINGTYSLSGNILKRYNDSILLLVNYNAVMCLNRNGTAKWTRGFSLANGTFANIIPLLVTNNPTRYWFSGVYGLSNETFPVIFSTDADGNFIGMNGLVSRASNFQINDMVKLNDGNMIAVGTYSMLPDNIPYAVAIKLSSSGNLVWTRTYKTSINYYGTVQDYAPSSFNAIRSYSNGKIVIAATSSMVGNLKLTINESGAVEETDYYKDASTEGNVYAFKFGANEYATLGSIDAPSAASSDITLKIQNTATHSSWTRSYQWGGKDIPSGVIKTLDGGYLLSGLTNKGIGFSPVFYASLFKVNSGGLIGCEGTAIATGSPFYNLYPIQTGSDSVVQLCHDSAITYASASTPPTTSFTYNNTVTGKEIQCLNSSVSNQWLTLIFPKVVNAQFKSGGIASISWGSANLPLGARGLATVKLEYSIDGGSNWKLIAPSIPAFLAMYSWPIPKDESTDCKIRISSNENSSFADTSSISFSLKPETAPYISITYPNGGEVYQPSSTVTIKWDAPNITEKVKIQYTLNGGRTLTTIEAAANNTGTYSWVVPNVASDSALIIVSGTQSIYSFNSQSGYFFRINGTATGLATTGIDALISLYPNPANSVLNVSSVHNISKVELYNLTGSLVLTTSDQTINIALLQSGIYFVKAYTEKGSVTQKFIKQ